MEEERGDLHKILECQDILHRILSIATRDLCLNSALEEIAEILTHIPWLPETRKSAIFLKEAGSNELVMKASRGLPDMVTERCRKIQLGECLCGLSALKKEVLFSDHVDYRHTIRFEGMEDHGHYCIPLLWNDDLLGVVTLYLEKGHTYDPVESAFLKTIGTAITDVIRYILLKDKERKLSIAIDQAPDWVVMTNRDGVIEYVNPAVEEITGYSKEELIGKTPRVWKSGIHTREFFEDMWNRLLSGQSFRGTFINRKKNGEIFYVDQTITPIKDENENTIGFIATGKDVTEHRIYEERIYRLAYYDETTGLPNRNYFIEKGQSLVNDEESVALVILDLDRFKFLNDTYGAPVGNYVLREIADRLREALPPDALLARIGNDEFGMIVPHVKSEKRVGVLVRRLLRCVSERIDLGGKYVAITGSAGVSISPYHGKTLSELMRSADLALAHAKEEGKNRFMTFDSAMSGKVREIVSFTGNLVRLKVGESFSLRYQPIVDLSTHKVVALEALLRWKGRRVSPERFVSILEETGLIDDVSLWILERAVDFLNTIHDRCDREIRVSVNVSPVNLMSQKFVNRAIAMLRDSNLPADRIILEITENILVKNENFLKESIAKLKDTGVNLAMDDFGAGYTSLKYINRYPIDVVKFDRLFLKDVERSDRGKALARNLISTMRDIGISTIAEGVETEDQYRTFLDLNCDLCQGFYFYRPMAERSVKKLLCPQA